MSAPAFTLSAYEETKQRMRQLQMEQMQARKTATDAIAVANAAASTTAEAKDSSSSAASSSGAGGSSSSKGRLERAQSATSRDASSRAFTTSTSRVPSTRDTAGAPSTSAAGGPRSSPTAARATSARPTMPPPTNQFSAAPSASSSNAAAADFSTPLSPRARAVLGGSPAVPASSYSPLSPRSSSHSNGWTSERTAASTHQAALALNHALGSPRSRSGAHGSTGNLSSAFESTAPFQVAVAAADGGALVASPAPSASSTPRSSSHTHSSASGGVSSSDPFAPSLQPIPSVSASLDAHSAADRAAFQSKLEALQQVLVSTAQAMGLKYSLDSRLKQLVHELDGAHAASLRSAQQSVERVKADWQAAASVMASAQTRYESELTRARLTLADRQRKLERHHTVSLARATKEAESVARGEYAEKAKRFDAVEKYNGEKLKQLEDQLRVQLKAAMVADAKKTKVVEQTLQAKLEHLEQAGMQIVQEKEAQVEQLRGQLAAAEARGKEAIGRAHTWERKVEKLASEVKRHEADLATARVELAQQKTENVHLLSKLDRTREDALATERELTGQASTLANRLMDVTAEVETAKARVKEMERQVEREREQMAQTTRDMKQKHALELDTIQTRITGVLQRKDDQIGQLQQQVQIQAQKVRDIERELGSI